MGLQREALGSGGGGGGSVQVKEMVTDGAGQMKETGAPEGRQAGRWESQVAVGAIVHLDSLFISAL